MDSTWWFVIGFIAGGLVLGAFAGIVARRLLDRERRRPAIRQAARPTAALLFWLFVAAGLVAAVAASSPETLEPIPSRVLRWLPSAGVAGLIVIAGFVAGTIVATAIGRASERATGRRQPLVETSARVAVVSAAMVLALTQLGIDTTILNILVAAVVFGCAVALAGLAVFGGRHVARNVAAGKTMAELLDVDDEVTIGGMRGRISRITPTHVLLDGANGETAAIPLGVTDREPVVIHRQPARDAPAQ